MEHDLMRKLVLSQLIRVTMRPPCIFPKHQLRKKGWGAVFGGQDIEGRWVASEASRHKKVLELEAAFFALKSFGDKFTGAHIQLHLDNTTALAYINNMGGSKSVELNCVTIKIWDWSMQRDNWISAVHLAGKLNVSAEKAREHNQYT